jgi:hypothetical protein
LVFHLLCLVFLTRANASFCHTVHIRWGRPTLWEWSRRDLAGELNMSGRRLSSHMYFDRGQYFSPALEPCACAGSMDPAVPRSPVPAYFRSLWESGRQSGSHLVHLIVHADASNVDHENEIREAWKAKKVTCPKHLPALITPARQSHQHPQATSRMPETHCARSTPSAHPFQRPQISAPLSDTLCPTLVFARTSFELCVLPEAHPAG